MKREFASLVASLVFFVIVASAFIYCAYEFHKALAGMTAISKMKSESFLKEDKNVFHDFFEGMFPEKSGG